MLAERVEEAQHLAHQLGQDAAGVGRTDVHLQVFDDFQLGLGDLPEALRAEHLAGLEVGVALGRLVVYVDLPVLPLASVLVLHVEAVSGLEALDAAELDGVEGQIGLVGLEGSALSDERVEAGEHFIVFEEREIVGVGAVELVAEHKGAGLAVLYLADPEAGLVGRSDLQAWSCFAEQFG